jgi:hypothetical protein
MSRRASPSKSPIATPCGCGLEWRRSCRAAKTPAPSPTSSVDVGRLVIGDHDVDAAVAGQIACRQRRRMRATGCRRRHRESAASVTEEREQLSGVPGDHKISGTVGVDAGRQRRRRPEAGRQLETHRRREWSSRAAHCDGASGPHAFVTLERACEARAHFFSSVANRRLSRSNLLLQCR